MLLDAAWLILQAFAWNESDKMQPGFFKSYTEQAEAFYQQSVYQDSINQLTRALSNKREAGPQPSLQYKHCSVCLLKSDLNPQPCIA